MEYLYDENGKRSEYKQGIILIAPITIWDIDQRTDLERFETKRSPTAITLFSIEDHLNSYLVPAPIQLQLGDYVRVWKMGITDTPDHEDPLSEDRRDDAYQIDALEILAPSNHEMSIYRVIYQNGSRFRKN